MKPTQEQVIAWARDAGITRRPKGWDKGADETEQEPPCKAGSQCVGGKCQRCAVQEPEPVAWMYDWYDETEDIDGVPIGGIFHDWISKNYDEAHSPTMGCHNIRPLYTAPPQREWQGLTDEELNLLWVDYHGNSCLADGRILNYERAIEAKLREKNA